MTQDIPALIAEARAVVAHPLENRPWREIVARLADALEAEHQRAEENADRATTAYLLILSWRAAYLSGRKKR